MKKLKALLSVTLAALVSVCSLPLCEIVGASDSDIPVAAAAEAGETAEGLLYVADNGLATVTGYNGSGRSVTIPEKIDGSIVVKIAKKAFLGASLDEVHFPSSIEEVECFYDAEENTISYPHSPFAGSTVKKAYFAEGTKVIPECILSGARALEEIYLPDSVEVIGKEAFMYCTSLTAVHFGGGEKKCIVDTIEEGAFSYCVNLPEISFPDTLRTIDDDAFLKCLSLERVNLNKVSYIGAAAFVGTAISEITIPETLTETYHYFEGETDTGSYEHGPFAGYNLKKVVFSKGIKKIPDYILGGARGVTDITIPEGVKEIGAGAFEYCTELKKISLPEGIETVNGEALRNCTELTEISFPDTLKTVKEDAFFGCDKLTKVNLNKVSYIGEGCFVETAIEEITIPATLTEVGIYFEADEDTETYAHGPFAGKNLKKVVFSDGIKVIPAHTLSGAGNVTDILIPDGVTEIGEGAFRGLSAVKEILLPDTVEIIGEDAFSDCKEVKLLRLFKSIKSVGDNSFDGLYILTAEDTDAVIGMIDDETSYRAIIAGIKDKDYRLLDRENSGYTLSENEDGTYSLEIAYSFKEKVRDAVAFTEIKVKMPEKTEFRYTTVTVNGQKCDDYSLSGGVLKLDAENTEGKIVIKGLIGVGEEFSSYAEIDGRHNGKAFSEIIGIINPMNYSKEYEIALTGSAKNVKKLLEETAVVTLGCTAGELLGVSNATLITDKDGNAVGENEKITTGMMLSRRIGNVEVDFRNIAVLGDVDGNMKITAADARLALRTSVGLENYDADTAEFRASDVDFNGKVTAADARTILRTSVGLETLG